MGCAPSIPHSTATQHEWDRFCLPVNQFLEGRMENNPREVIHNPDAYFHIRKGSREGQYYAIRIGGQAFEYNYDDGILYSARDKNVYFMLNGYIRNGRSTREITNVSGGVYFQLWHLRYRSTPCPIVLPSCPVRTEYYIVTRFTN